MTKTLVIILAETRTHELTFDNFKRNVIDELNADLCVCIGVKSDYDYENPFYKLAKYRFLYDEPEDYATAFDYAYNEITKNEFIYEKMENVYSMFESNPMDFNENMTYLGELCHNIHNCDKNNIHIKLEKNISDITKYDEIIIHTSEFENSNLKNKCYGKNNGNIDDFRYKENVVTYKKKLHWRELLKLKEQLFGGIIDNDNPQHGSSAILIFFRWFLLKNLLKNNLINEYDRFVITRSDFIYLLPHPSMNVLDEKYIWVPNGEKYGGITDRHAILSKQNIVTYLNLLDNLINNSNTYFMLMKKIDTWNLERFILFNICLQNEQNNIKFFPYVMYSVRNINGSTRWQKGEYSKEHNYYIKYKNEYESATEYEQLFRRSIDDFYRKEIEKI